MFFMFLWSFIDPQLCSESCGSFLFGLVFLARELFGILGVRALLIILSVLFIGFTVQIARKGSVQ